MKPQDMRLAALRRFATAITVLNIVGHTVLGFEQSYAQVFAVLFVAYSTEILLETIDAGLRGRVARWRGGVISLVNFLLPAHITGLAVSMLLYANQTIMPLLFAVIVAIGSKHVFKVHTERGPKHFFNPSNIGICVVLLVFPWVGIAPPYQFTENISGGWDWFLPCFFILVGTFLNAKFTRKLPLIGAWVGGFVLQAVVRSFYFDTPIAPALNPISGVAFLLFTYYMITDPGTTPFKPKMQVLFGSSVALCYGILMTNHIVFGLFFALLPVCAIRGGYMYYEQRHAKHISNQETSPMVNVEVKA